MYIEMSSHHEEEEKQIRISIKLFFVNLGREETEIEKIIISSDSWTRRRHEQAKTLPRTLSPVSI